MLFRSYQINSNSALTPGPGCDPAGGGVFCRAPANPLGFVFAWGDSGGDSINIGAGFPPTTMVMANGGHGSDLLSGGPDVETLHAGESGSDRLQGGLGDDALISRGRDGDTLDAGDGADQLVTNDPCGGHEFDGGPGRSDVAGFAHVVANGVNAKLGGGATLQGAGNCSATQVRGSNEILEGTRLGDVLIGDGRPNLIIGREGNDMIKGLGGRDELRGDAGADSCVGGAPRKKNLLMSC